MQFSVPQFINVKDKVFGPFTTQQFLFIMGGVGFGLIEYFAVSIPIFVILIIPTSALFLALAFYKVNGRAFYFFLANMSNFLIHPTRRFWHRDPLLPKLRTGFIEEPDQKIQKGTIKKKGLSRLAHILDFEIPIKESIAPQKQKEVYPDLY